MEKIKKLVGDILELDAGFRSLAEREDLDGRLAYAVERSAQGIKGVVKAHATAAKMPKGVQKFNEERLTLARSHARKDAAGSPVLHKNTFVFDDPEEFESLVAKLREKYSADLEAWEKRMETLESEMETKEEEVELHLTTPATFPTKLSPLQLRALIALTPKATKEEWDAYFDRCDKAGKDKKKKPAED